MLFVVGVWRADGLPGWWSPASASTRPAYRDVQRRRDGVLARCALTAIDSDLEGLPLSRWGTLDLVEQRARVEIDRSPARAQRKRGRLLLHRLGVWPWAHADDGNLPYAWNGRNRAAHVEPPFDEPLNRWHEAAAAEMRGVLDRLAS